MKEMTPEEQRKLISTLGWGPPGFADMVYHKALETEKTKKKRQLKEKEGSPDSEEE